MTRTYTERAPIILEAPELDAYATGYAVLDRAKRVLAHFEPGLFDVFKASDFVKGSDEARYIVRCSDHVVIARRGSPLGGSVAVDGEGLPPFVDGCDPLLRDASPVASTRCARGQVA